MKSLRDESGQALVVVALGLTSLLGFVGLAVDVGALVHNKRELQVAADAAAIAAALSQNASGYVAAGNNASALNGFPNGGNVTVTIHATPTWGEYLGQSGYYEAIVQKNEPTIFMGLFGHGTVPVLARAVATRKSTVNGGCVYTLGATGMDISFTGAADVQAPNCGIADDSSSTNAMYLNGAIIMNMGSIGVVGGVQSIGSEIVTPTPVQGIIPYSDPLSWIPQYTCTTTSCTNNGGTTSVTCKTAKSSYTANTTISPGCYDGLSISGASNITFSPGTYIINSNGATNSGFSVSGASSLTGTGVTIYMASGAMSIGSSTVMNLSAPTTGTYNGILFDQSPGDTNAATFAGATVLNIKGITYFPDAAVNFTGATAGSIYTDFVVQSLSANGALSFNDYASLSGVNSPLTSVTLVE